MAGRRRAAPLIALALDRAAAPAGAGAPVQFRECSGPPTATGAKALWSCYAYRLRARGAFRRPPGNNSSATKQSRAGNTKYW